MKGRYSIPEISEVVPRPRLFEYLDRDVRVFLITGQAAQGKSTLVASFLRQKSQPCIWCHLTDEASDHARLFEILMSAVQDRLGQSPTMPETLIPQSTLGIREDLLRQAETLAMVFEQIDFPLNIVFDDLESLDKEATSFSLMDRMIKETQGLIRFFFLSRGIPPLNLQQLKMENKVLVLDNQDLAFTSEEALQFFRLKLQWDRDPANHNNFSPGDVEKILRVTEGWAGGLTLVSESFRQFRNLERLPERMSSNAFAYFSEEIYQSQPNHIRDFLMKSSIFNLLDTRILQAFFEDLDPVTILEELEDRNLFIQKIDAHPSWPVYKYNLLFRDYLKSCLTQALKPGEINTLEQKAGDIFWEMKRHEDAALHYIRSGSFEQMATIIRIKGTHYVVSGQTASLAEWIEKMPGDMIQKDPWLVFFKAMTRRIKAGKKNMEAFSRALELFTAAKDQRGMMLSTAFNIEAAVFVRQPSPVILLWIQAGEAILRERKGSQKYTWARTILWQHIGLGYIAGTGDIPAGISACQNAIFLAKSIENPDLLLNASIVMTLGLVQSGDFRQARKMLDRIQTITGRSPHPEYRALKRITRLDYDLKRGNYDEAKILLEESEADIDRFGLIFLYPGFVEARSVFFTGVKEFTQALQTAGHLADFSILEGNDFYLGISHRLKAAARLLMEDYQEAVAEARLAVTELEQSKRGDIHYFLARQILGFSLFFTHDLKAAEEELDQTLFYFQKIASDLFYCETALMAGLTAWEANNPKRAAQLLDQGAKKARTNQYAYFPMISERTLARILVTMHLAGTDAGSISWFSNLAAKGRGALVQEEIQTSVEAVPVKERAFRAEKLRSLHRLSLPKIRITTLGEFNVMINGESLDPAAFGGLKPKSLLKIMVLRGLKEIHKDTLIESLWPDASQEAGEKNFKINLHRLRKALEPDPAKIFGYSYVLQKAGLVSLDPDLICLDTDEFRILVDQALSLEKQDRLDQAIETYEQAANLYQGDYFSEDPYLEEASGPRESFRSELIKILGQKARLHEELDQWDLAVETWRHLLAKDPVNEAGYRNLMILYADSGRINEALRIFEECRKVLEKELDTAPGTRTLDVFRKIEKLKTD